MFGIGGGGFNLNSIMNAAMFTAGFVTGGATWAALAQQVFQNVAMQAFQGALNQMGIGGPMAELMMGAFAQGMGFTPAEGGLEDLIGQVISEANGGETYTGDLDRAVSDLTDQITQALLDAERDAREGESTSSASGSSEGKSWLVAIAEALGKAMGEHAANMVGYANDMNNATGGGDDPEAAREFAALQAKMQGEAQMFSIASSTMATTIKAIGEGLSGVARKQ